MFLVLIGELGTVFIIFACHCTDKEKLTNSSRNTYFAKCREDRNCLQEDSSVLRDISGQFVVRGCAGK